MKTGHPPTISPSPTSEYPYIWFWHKALPERWKQRCRILALIGVDRCTVEFEDGYQALVKRWALRRAD
jgi:hypothetical protein